MSLLSKLIPQKSNLTPKGEKFWQTLLRHIEWSQDFCLIFLFSPKPTGVDVFRQRLADHFRPSAEQLERISPTFSHLSEDIVVLQIRKRLDELFQTGEVTHAPIWVELDRGLSSKQAVDVISILFARLNERRELLRNYLHRPLIFVLPSAYKRQLREISPDLWSIRDYSFDLGELGKIEQENPVKTILGKLKGLFSGFQRRYNQQVIYEHRVFNVRGLRTMGTFTLELEHVFVELRIAKAANPLKPTNALVSAAKELAGNRPIWAFLRFNNKAHFEETQVFAVIGVPGCGKTTLLQHIALTLAHKQQRRYGLPAYIPLLLFLRHHVQTIVEQAPTLAELAHTHFSSDTTPELNPPPNWFAQHLKSGKCLILLDGLDEVADLEQRRAVSDWVEQQIINYPRCRFILTSRPQGYLTAPVEQANVLEVQPFNAEQVRRFVHAWYLANEVTSFGGKLDDGVRNKAKQEADDLLQRLRKTPTLSELTVNPLLLTMIAMVHRYRGQLPGRRVELYAEICDVLLGHWRQAKGIQDNLTAAQKRVVLQPLARQMMYSNLREIPINEAMQIINGPLKRVGLVDEAAQTFLSDVQASSGLLLESEQGVWRFAHLTFQEYLAAAQFVEQQTALDWNNLVNNCWWHETLRLYAAQADATPLVQACLDNNRVTALTLAADCLDEARELDATVRSQVESHLIDDLESDEPQRRQLAAEVRLSQRLKSLQRVDEQREIDLDYISCAEYQLFLDEKRAEGKYYQPDHWTDYTFPNGTAQEPIRGVRDVDAEAFCKWLSQRQSGCQIRYRLPSHAEIRDYPSITGANNLAAWCQENEGYSLNGFIKAEESNIYAKLKQISELPFEFHLDLARDLALDRARARTSDRVHAIARTISIDLTCARDLALDRARARVNTLVGTHLSNDIYRAIKEGNLQAAKQFAQAIQTESNPAQQRLGTLLYILLDCATAITPLKARQALRKYLTKLAEYTWIGYNELEKQKDNRSWWQRWFSRRQIDYNEDRQALLNLYWWLQLVIAREEGQLPAWEGIRIVRERELL
jgi:energy-coupling factor transporter ATP-binding protein EcfA2